MLSNKGVVLFFVIVVFLSSCFSSQEPDTTPDRNFCASIKKETNSSLSKELVPLAKLIDTKTGVYVLEEGDISMISRAWLSDYAEQSIDIQYFIFSTDNVGLIATDYLLRAADRGVKVRILVDDIMIEANADELLVLDRHPNLSIKVYNPNANLGKNITKKLLSLSKDFRAFNQRMHNKTFIVDNKVVITGGRNIADEYFDYDHEYNFRDRDVLLLGKVTENVSESFTRFWSDSLSVPINQIVDSTDTDLTEKEIHDFLHQYACNPDNFWPQVREKITTIPDAFRKIQASGNLHWVDQVNFVSDIPGKNDGSNGLNGGGITTDTLINLIKKAQKSIMIQSPYLVTTELSRNLFSEAKERGVEIKILTNSLASTDNLEAFNGYQRDREELLKTGVRIYEFKPDAAIRREIMTGALQKEIDYTPTFGLHAKSMVIDNKIAVIGTFNLDPRSANLNTECLTIIYDDTIAADLYEVMQKDILPENAWETTMTFNPDSVAGTWKQLKAKTRRVVPKSIL